MLFHFYYHVMCSYIQHIISCERKYKTHYQQVLQSFEGYHIATHHDKMVSPIPFVT